MLAPDYIKAIETRLAWLRWSGAQGEEAWRRLGYQRIMPTYQEALAKGDTFTMEPHFCDLVDHARVTMPNDITYDARWLLAPYGFLWLPRPFTTPTLTNSSFHDKALYQDESVQIKVRALGWIPVAPGQKVWHGHWSAQTSQYERNAEPSFETSQGSTHFMFFQDFMDYQDFQAYQPKPGFGCWSFFTLRDGDNLAARITKFESKQEVAGVYPPSPLRESLHELRWLYTALHLMAQKLATTRTVPTDRPTRRRAQAQGQQAPPFIKVVTLRRLEQAREQEGHGQVDWHWQWTVRGHWRDQWFPSEGVHKPVFIEAYVKGPADKPLKPDSIKLFVGKR